MDEYEKIIINGLSFDMSVGIYDFEKARKQRIMIDLEITVNYKAPPESIEDALSYEKICNDIEGLCQSSHYDLLETLAEDIFKHCLSDNKILYSELAIYKPDIIKNTDSVGVKYARRNVKS